MIAKGAIGFWQANTIGDDTVDSENMKWQNYNLESLRQQIKKAAGQSNFSLADFIIAHGRSTVRLYWRICSNHSWH